MSKSKRQEIDEIKDEFKTLKYYELSHEAQKVAFTLMKSEPNNWQTLIKTNRKHTALIELMRERKSSI